MRVAPASTSEVAIFARVLEPDQATLDPAAARAILHLDFKRADKDRMRQLLAKAKAASLSADEETEIDNYERVGHMLSLLKLKARRSLKARARQRNEAENPLSTHGPRAGKAGTATGRRALRILPSPRG